MRIKDYVILVLGVFLFASYICFNLYALGKFDMEVKRQVFKYYGVDDGK